MAPGGAGVTRPVLVAFVASAVLATAPPAQALPGDLDPAFGVDGIVTTDFSPFSIDGGRAIALESDGRIVVAGQGGTSGSFGGFGLARYLADGDLDPTFAGGIVVTDMGGGIADAVVVQGDGKIVAVGRALRQTDEDFGLARYDEDGGLDPTFGRGGRQFTDFGSKIDEAFGAAIQSDGKIIAVGGGGTGFGGDFVVARYLPDGSLDPSFGTGGAVQTDFNRSADAAFAVAIQSDGKIVVAGQSFPTYTDGNFALARYEPDGSLDGAFGIGGLVTTDFGGTSDIGRALVVLGDGRILVGGNTTSATTDFGVARYNADGGLDGTFGEGGLVHTDFYEGEDTLSGLVVDSDGSIVATGTRFGELALTRYALDGSVDLTFGVAGRVVTDATELGDTASGAAIQPDGRILVAGESGGGDQGDFLVARYLPGPGPRPSCTINGTSGPDILLGTDGPDVICGGAGDDELYGLGGDDILIGSEGNDFLNGASGNDRLLGGPGDDRLTTEDSLRGNDLASGGPGVDHCRLDTNDVAFGCLHGDGSG